MRKITALSVKESRAKTLAALPERLQRLNRELCIERSKDFDNDLYAVRRDHRFRVSVFRCSTGFVATTQAGGRVHRYNGTLPSDAFIKLTKSLEWLVSKLDWEKNVALAAAKRYESA